ncbi:MAG: hypothetical protein ACEPOW_00180 [Bacteroidales bacterium]
MKIFTKKLLGWFSLVFVIFLFKSCQDQITSGDSLISTAPDATFYSDEEIHIEGKIKHESDEIIEFGHCISAFPEPTYEDQHSSFTKIPDNREFQSEFSKLEASKKYFIRAYVKIKEQIFYSGEICVLTLNFRILPLKVTKKGRRSLEVNGGVQVHSGEILDYGFYYGESNDDGIYSNKKSFGIAGLNSKFTYKKLHCPKGKSISFRPFVYTGQYYFGEIVTINSTERIVDSFKFEFIKDTLVCSGLIANPNKDTIEEYGVFFKENGKSAKRQYICFSRDKKNTELRWKQKFALNPQKAYNFGFYYSSNHHKVHSKLYQYQPNKPKKWCTLDKKEISDGTIKVDLKKNREISEWGVVFSEDSQPNLNANDFCLRYPSEHNQLILKFEQLRIKSHTPYNFRVFAKSIEGDTTYGEIYRYSKLPFRKITNIEGLQWPYFTSFISGDKLMYFCGSLRSIHLRTGFEKTLLNHDIYNFNSTAEDVNGNIYYGFPVNSMDSDSYKFAVLNLNSLVWESIETLKMRDRYKLLSFSVGNDYFVGNGRVGNYKGPRSTELFKFDSYKKGWVKDGEQLKNFKPQQLDSVGNEIAYYEENNQVYMFGSGIVKGKKGFFLFQGKQVLGKLIWKLLKFYNIPAGFKEGRTFYYKNAFYLLDRKKCQMLKISKNKLKVNLKKCPVNIYDALKKSTKIYTSESRTYCSLVNNKGLKFVEMTW